MAISWKTWDISAGDTRSRIKIVCPHCGKSALVYKSWLKKASSDLPTRPCTYCFKTSKMKDDE